MTQTCHKQESLRYRFVFDKVPTMRVNRYGGSCEFYSSPRSYGQVLDCIYEMTLDIVDANADEPEKAIEQVLSDEGWRILPTHKKAVLDRVRLMAFNKT